MTAEKVQLIHNTNSKIVLAATGGGSTAISELFKYGGASKTILEATIPYVQSSFDEFVKNNLPGGFYIKSVEKYCSPIAAEALADAAFRRAKHLTHYAQNEHCVGIGITCALATNNEREGRHHKMYFAVRTYDTTFFLDLVKTQGSSRQEEEENISEILLNALAEILSNNQCPNGWDMATYRDTPVVDVVNQRQYCVYLENGQNKDINFADKDVYILPGSFNPLHEQHVFMKESVEKVFNCKVFYELSIENVDKLPLGYRSIRQRTNNLESVLLTNAPLFLDKALIFENARSVNFVIGFDTLERIGDCKYNAMFQTIEPKENRFNRMIQEGKVKFIVFHRIIDGKSTDGRAVPMSSITTVMDPNQFPPSSISSTKIRNAT